MPFNGCAGSSLSPFPLWRCWSGSRGLSIHCPGPTVSDAAPSNPPSPTGDPRHRHPQPRRSLTVVPSLPTSSHELGAWKAPEREAGRGGDARSVALGARATLDRAHPRLQLGGDKGAPPPCPGPSLLIPYPRLSARKGLRKSRDRQYRPVSTSIRWLGDAPTLR